MCISRACSLPETVKICLEWNDLSSPPLLGCEGAWVCESLYRAETKRRTRRQDDYETQMQAMNKQYAWVDKKRKFYRVATTTSAQPTSTMRADQFGRRARWAARRHAATG